MQHDWKELYTLNLQQTKAKIRLHRFYAVTFVQLADMYILDGWGFYPQLNHW